ncbi:MAG: TonB family protein [Gammaproteobacteria bacterium]|jgi:protein TonB
MTAMTERRPKPGSRDRLVTTLFFAALVHGMIILGVGFTAPDPDPGQGSTLEVTIVPEADDQAPDKADYLAQANQHGAGNTDRNVRPQSPMATPSRINNAGVNDGNSLRSATELHRSNQRPDTLRAPDNNTRSVEHVTTRGNSSWTLASRPTPAPSSQDREVLVARLMTEGIDSADPTSENNQLPVAHSDNPRDRFISVNTRESRFAVYLEAWREKVEQVGNLHYPDSVKKHDLSGKLALEVAVNADGSLEEVRTIKSSGQPLLDQAAARIVHLAAPFAPFPNDIRKDTDVLRFVYVWEFNNGSLTSGGSIRSHG